MSFNTEEEIRPRNIFQDLLECCKLDAEYLLQNVDFEVIACPSCKTLDFEIAFIKNGFQFVNCISCNSLYNNPRPT